MDLIDRGPVKLRYFTVARSDFVNMEPHPPHDYFLVTQVYRYNDDYICTQLLGIDSRAVKYLAKQGCEQLSGQNLSAKDRERVEACLDAYSRGILNKVADRLMGPIMGHWSDRMH